MCGLAGVIFGRKQRRAEEREWRELPGPAPF